MKNTGALNPSLDRPLSHKESAEVLSHGLAVGCYSVANATAWADSIIAAVDEPDAAVIEVAMGANLDRVDIIKLLRNFPGVSDLRVVLAHVLPDSYRMLIVHPERGPWVAAYLEELSQNDQIREELDGALSTFSAAYVLADERLGGTYSEITRELVYTLARYAGADKSD